MAYDVTPYVTIDTNYASFAPLNYGVKQTLRVYVNLADVNAVYAPFNHIQILDITLNNPGTTRPPVNTVPNWTVSTVSGELPAFGQGVYAKFYAPGANSYQVSLAGDFTTQAAWLAACYTNTYPQYNPLTESGPVVPTHFVIGSTAYLLSQWNAQLTLTNTLVNNGTLIVQFINRTGSGDQQLAVAGIALRQIDVGGNYL
jgi:hypothetical protein